MLRYSFCFTLAELIELTIVTNGRKKDKVISKGSLVKKEQARVLPKQKTMATILTYIKLGKRPKIERRPL